MKVLGKKKKNFIIEVTEYELNAIEIALMEWSFIEHDTSKPDTRYDKVFNRIAKAKNHFDSLPLIKQKSIKNPKIQQIELKDDE